MVASCSVKEVMRVVPRLARIAWTGEMASRGTRGRPVGNDGIWIGRAEIGRSAGRPEGSVDRTPVGRAERGADSGKLKGRPEGRRATMFDGRSDRGRLGLKLEVGRGSPLRAVKTALRFGTPELTGRDASDESREVEASGTVSTLVTDRMEPVGNARLGSPETAGRAGTETGSPERPGTEIDGTAGKATDGRAGAAGKDTGNAERAGKPGTDTGRLGRLTPVTGRFEGTAGTAGIDTGSPVGTATAGTDTAGTEGTATPPRRPPRAGS